MSDLMQPFRGKRVAFWCTHCTLGGENMLVGTTHDTRKVSLPGHFHEATKKGSVELRCLS